MRFSAKALRRTPFLFSLLLAVILIYSCSPPVFATTATFGLTSTGSTSYPITEAGRTTADDSYANVPNNDYMAASLFTTTSPLVVTEVHVKIRAACNIKVALYSDNAGVPGSLIYAKNTGTYKDYILGFTGITIDATYIATGTYWIGIKCDTNQAFNSATSGSGYYIAHGYATAFPDPFGSGSGYNIFDAHISAFKLKALIFGVKASLPGPATSFDSVSFYSHSATGNIRAAVYDTDKALVWESASTAVTATSNWQTITISSITNKAAGNYYICWQYDNLASMPSYTAGSAGDGFYKAQTYGAYPSTISGETSTAEKWSIYVTYTATTFGLTSTGSTSYPITEVGRTAADTSYANVPNPSYMAASIFTTTFPLVVKEIHVRTQYAGNAKVALYSDNAGVPGSLIYAKNTETACAAGTFNTITIDATYIATGTYWIGIKYSYANQGVYNAGSGTGGYYIAHAYTTDFPASFGSGGGYYIFTAHISAVKLKALIFGMKATLSETATSFSKISFYSHSATGNGRFSVFDNANPKALIWESASTALSANAWVDVTITGVTNKAADTYWLCWQYDDVASAPSYTAGSAGDGFYKAQTYGAYPSTISGETSTAEKWSIYLTYSTTSVSVTYSRTATATISAANTASRWISIGDNIPQAIGVALNVQRVLGALRGSTQGLTIESVPTRVATFFRVSDQIMAIANDPSRWVSISQTVEQPMAISNQVTRVVSFIREPPTQAITISVEGTRVLIHVRGVSQPIAVTPDATTMYAISRSIQQQITMGVAAFRGGSFSHVIEQQIALSPVAEGQSLIIRGVSQYLQMVNDAVSTGLYDRIIGQAVTLSGTSSYWQVLSRIVNQGITMSASTYGIQSLSAIVQVSLAIANSVTRLGLFLRNPSLSLTLAQVVEALNPMISRVVSQAIGLIVSITPQSLFNRTATLSFALTDQATKISLIIRYVLQAIGLSPDAVRAGFFQRESAVSMALITTIETLSTFVRILMEDLLAIDQLSSAFQQTRILTEGLSVAASLNSYQSLHRLLQIIALVRDTLNTAVRSTLLIPLVQPKLPSTIPTEIINIYILSLWGSILMICGIILLSLLILRKVREQRTVVVVQQ